MESRVNFNSSPWASGNWYWKGGTNEMNSPLCGNCSLRVRGGYYHLNCANAFLYPSGSSKALVFENGDAFTFDLVTGSQKFASLADKTAGFSDKAVFTSATGQDVHLDASSGSYIFRGRFTGNVNLFVDAAQTLTLTNRSTSTGTLSLTNGAKVVFTPTGSWAGRIAIAGNGDEKLFVSNQVHAAQLVVGGQTLAPGWYGPAAPVAANRLPCIGGDGVLAVGMDDVAGYVKRGRTIAFIGSSGVGKSTLLNALAGEDWMATQEIQEWSGKGRHTTTSRELAMLPCGAMIVDTPGIREIGRVGEDDAILAKGESTHRYRK